MTRQAMDCNKIERMLQNAIGTEVDVDYVQNPVTGLRSIFVGMLEYNEYLDRYCVLNDDGLKNFWLWDVENVFIVDGTERTCVILI